MEINGNAVSNTAGTPLLAGTEDMVNRVLGLVPALATVNLDPASDSGASSSDGLTNIKTPTFDVQVNQAGTITIYAKLDANVRLSLDQDVKALIQKNPNLF